MTVKTVVMKASPRKADSLEKYKTIIVTQPGNPEYKQFTEKYDQVRKGRWKLSGSVQVSPTALKNPAKYPDLADEWLDGKVHRLGSSSTFSSEDVLEQIKYEFRYAGMSKRGHLRVVGIIDEKEDKPSKPGCWYANLRRSQAKKPALRRRNV